MPMFILVCVSAAQPAHCNVVFPSDTECKIKLSHAIEFQQFQQEFQKESGKPIIMY